MISVDTWVNIVSNECWEPTICGNAHNFDCRLFVYINSLVIRCLRSNVLSTILYRTLWKPTEKAAIENIKSGSCRAWCLMIVFGFPTSFLYISVAIASGDHARFRKHQKADEREKTPTLGSDWTPRLTHTITLPSQPLACPIAAVHVVVSFSPP